MDLEELDTLIGEFCLDTHGRTEYGRDNIFVENKKKDGFAPLKFLRKKSKNKIDVKDLLDLGFSHSAYNYLESSNFQEHYEKQFARKLPLKGRSNISILIYPDKQVILENLRNISDSFKILRDHFIIMNSKNFPIQLGEWYAKYIFGLKQSKSTSQRGFDFFLNDQKVEVKVHWSDTSSPKGVKIKKSLLGLSDYLILIYVGHNFFIRDLCILDSDFVLRKHSGKGHTIFLKDSDICYYFFSKSDKQYDKVVNRKTLFQFSSPSLVHKMDEMFSAAKTP